MSVFGSEHNCEQLANLMKNVERGTRPQPTDEHLEGFMRIVKTTIKSGFEISLQAKAVSVSH
jgi:hypothetical protein